MWCQAQCLTSDELVQVGFWGVVTAQGKDAAGRSRLKSQVHLTMLGSSVSLIFGKPSRATEEGAETFWIGKSNRQADDDYILSRQERHRCIPLKTWSTRRPSRPSRPLGHSCGKPNDFKGNNGPRL